VGWGLGNAENAKGVRKTLKNSNKKFVFKNTSQSIVAIFSRYFLAFFA
jgi:hypothetical protein